MTISMVCGGLNGIRYGQYLTGEIFKTNNIKKLCEVVDF